MGMTLNERNPNIQSILIGTLAVSSSLVVPGVYFRKHSRIKNVYFVDQAGISLSASNHVLVALQDSAAVNYATVDTSAKAAVANAPLAMTLTTPDTVHLSGNEAAGDVECDVPAGTMLNVNVSNFGSGFVTKGVVLVEWYSL